MEKDNIVQGEQAHTNSQNGGANSIESMIVGEGSKDPMDFYWSSELPPGAICGYLHM